MRWAATKAAAIGNSRGSSGSSGGSRGWRVAATRHTSSTTTSTADSPFRSSYGLWIDNQEVPGSPSASRALVRSPATRTLLTEVTLGGAEDVDRAVRSAAASFEAGAWARGMDARGRSKVLLEMARLLEQQLPALATMEALQTGRALREMRAQLTRLPEWLEYFAAIARTHEGSCPPFPGPYHNYVLRVPLGVCGLITPWNHPLLIALKKVAPALAAGNSVVLKPPELAPVAVLELGRIAQEAGLPPGVLNIVPGLGPVAGKALAPHPLIRKVDVTGGTATGREIAMAAGQNLAGVVAELGGKAPVLVFEDADIEQAVDSACFAAFVAAGQTCVSGARLLVHRHIFDEVQARFVSKARGIRLGDPMELDTQMGPLISQQQRERVHAFVNGARQEGAAVLCGGGPPGPDSLPAGLRDGFFYQPTVLGSVTPAMRVWCEEVFGPVVCLVPFADEAEAVRLANDSAYGLGASIHTRDVKRAHRVADRVHAGIVWVNDHHRNSPSSPWGGVTAGSGLGRENGLEAFHEYTQSKSVVVGFGEERFDWFVPGAAAGGVRYS